jgi:hypothetical protein
VTNMLDRIQAMVRAGIAVEIRPESMGRPVSSYSVRAMVYRDRDWWTISRRHDWIDGDGPGFESVVASVVDDAERFIDVNTNSEAIEAALAVPMAEID